MQQAYQERGERLGPVETKLAEDIIPGLLASKFINQMQDAIDLANELKAPSTLGPLLDAVRITKGYPKLRAAAIGAVTAIDPEKSLPTLSAVLVNEKEDLDVREQIARALAGTNRPSSHEILIRAMAAAPGPLQSTIATGMAGSARGAETLLQAIEAGKASPRLLQDRGLVVRMQQTKLPELDARIAKLTRGLPAADEKLTQLLRDRKAEFAKGTWDSKQGHAVFVKHCAACHQISNEGAKIGPQLDGIGVRGLERVLEDVLDPHRNVDQAFRSTTLELKDGRVLSGLLLREEGAVLVMADNQGKEVRVPNADVENRTVSSLSPMPSNFWEQVPPDDFHRLMSFLLAQRPKN
jgi:putative heme-binding domain-containing protein